MTGQLRIVKPFKTRTIESIHTNKKSSSTRQKNNDGEENKPRTETKKMVPVILFKDLCKQPVL